MRKYLPSKDNIYNFIAGIILLLITLLVGNYYIAKINQRELIQQDYINNQNSFIRNFTQIGQKRVYLAENYYNNKKNNESKEILDRSWEKYMEAVTEWNSNNLLNPLFIKYYFGKNQQDKFFNNLLPKFNNLHNALLEIRSGKNINLDNSIEEAKHELFIYSESLLIKK